MGWWNNTNLAKWPYGHVKSPSSRSTVFRCRSIVSCIALHLLISQESAVQLCGYGCLIHACDVKVKNNVISVLWLLAMVNHSWHVAQRLWDPNGYRSVLGNFKNSNLDPQHTSRTSPWIHKTLRTPPGGDPLSRNFYHPLKVSRCICYWLTATPKSWWC